MIYFFSIFIYSTTGNRKKRAFFGKFLKNVRDTAATIRVSYLVFRISQGNFHNLNSAFLTSKLDIRYSILDIHRD